MPHIPQNVQWSPSWKLSDFAKSLQRIWQQMAQVVNNHISFGNPNLSALQGGRDNIDGAWVSFTIAVANADLILTHNLNRVPVGYIVMSKTGACDIYTGSVAPTSLTITIRGTVAGVSGELFVV